MSSEHEIWQWQEPGTAWKGVGIYHVTLTIPSREALLGTLIIPDNNPAKARVERTELGEAIVHTMFQIQDYHPEVRIIQFCVMPDHLHVILHVTRPMPKGIMTVVRGWWQGAKKIGRAFTSSISPNNIRDNERSNTQDNERSPIRDNERSNTQDNERSPIQDNERSPIRDNERPIVHPIFTEMPFVRPMSHKGQLQTIIRYVQMNPQRLATKRLKPGFFRVQEGIEIAGRTYRGVGNVALLQAARYAPVHVRRTMIDEAMHGDNTRLRDYMNGCVLQARKGAVMVSPFISDKEKEVMVVLLREGHTFIYLADNGFGDYYKPSGGLFDAVAAGCVLILSPWEHNADKRHISRADCVALNGMAEEICRGLMGDNLNYDE